MGTGAAARAVAVSASSLINSDTVRNWKPRASMSSSVEGMALIVSTWMSWQRMMEPGLASLKMVSCTLAMLRGDFQSSVSTSQRMVG